MTTSVLYKESDIQAIPQKGSTVAAICLISGTCIGGGMLAMPVQTASIGFGYSILGLFVCWLFMTFTGLCLLEATLWVKNETHFSSLARILVGNWVKVIAIIIYLFMNYASLVAYTAGGAALIQSLLPLGYEASCCLFTLLFGSCVYFGVQFLGKVNFLFTLLLALCYFGLVILGSSYIQAENLSWRASWIESLGSFSMILATFSYQMVVPSVCSYLEYDAAKLRRVVILGTTLPFIVYSLWIFVIHGVVSLDGLQQAFIQGHSATEPLHKQLNHWAITGLADSFAFLAVVTSYFGLSMALFHFLNDCFKEIKVDLSRNVSILLTIIPALILGILFPRALLQFLDLSGGYGDTILSGLIPIGLVWAGRYHKKLKSVYTVPGRKTALIVAACFFLGVLLMQIF